MELPTLTLPKFGDLRWKCSAAEKICKIIAVRCSLRARLLGVVRFADQNFLHHTISTWKLQ